MVILIQIIILRKRVPVKRALWESPELGEDMGVFWWWNHENTPICPLYHR
jgi:hypothetical protein